MALRRVDDDGRRHTVHAAGRAMPAEAGATWTRVIAEHLPAERPMPLVDLGSGVGRLTPGLAAT